MLLWRADQPTSIRCEGNSYDGRLLDRFFCPTDFRLLDCVLFVGFCDSSVTWGPRFRPPAFVALVAVLDPPFLLLVVVFVTSLLILPVTSSLCTFSEI